MKPNEIRSVEELTQLVASGLRAKYQFFWGHTPRVPGKIDQSCLSNWFPTKFTVDNIEYPTTEHFMMAEKARLFDDSDIRSQILCAGSPGAAKSLGRKVKGFDEDLWIAHRFEIVIRGNEAKFSQNASMREYLASTGTKILVEASPPDRIWGIGMAQDDERAANPKLWRGLNLLGFALMEVRHRICLTNEDKQQ